MTQTKDEMQNIQETTAFLAGKIGDFTPEIAIVLGSGLGNYAEQIQVHKIIPYNEIPHYKETGVVGHSGNLVFGEISNKKVVCQQGRYHFYEGHSIQDVVFPVRVMAALGAKTLIVTNASGGINLDFREGDIMLIRDQINFQGANPLIGPNLENLGPRFPDMSYAYDQEYSEKMLLLAHKLEVDIRQGTYLAVTGPCYETPAEIRMFRTLGADAVGMSTVPEVIAANHCGMRVLGLSCISNAAAGITDEKLDHTDVERVIGAMAFQFENLVSRWIEAI